MKKACILLTRLADLNELDQAFFIAKGYQTQILPLTEISLRKLSANEIAEIKATQWLFFTSQVPVESILKHAQSSVKIAVIGQKTAQAVINAGFTPTFISPKETKEMLLTTWQKAYPKKTRILYPKSQLADNNVEQMLTNYEVQSFIAYDNLFPLRSQKKLEKVLETKKSPPYILRVLLLGDVLLRFIKIIRLCRYSLLLLAKQQKKQLKKPGILHD